MVSADVSQLLLSVQFCQEDGSGLQSDNEEEKAAVDLPEKKVGRRPLKLDFAEPPLRDSQQLLVFRPFRPEF